MRWDYDVESPLRDARGFDMSRADADPSQLTDDDYGMANVVLTNGARFYVDHAHPEYSSPECTNPFDAMVWDAAGDLIGQRAAQLASDFTGSQIVLYKNNTDGKGASYGSHENYMVDRSVPFANFVTGLTAFFVSRPLIAGSGRVGIGQDGENEGFQLSSRADFFEAEVGLETTLRRPIINTRDEPHADPEKHRRLHVIVGDANLAQWSQYLKMGTTALVLSAIEAGLLQDAPKLVDPVAAMHQASHDLTFRAPIALRNGSAMSSLELQYWYLEKSEAFVDAQGDVDAQTKDVLSKWRFVLDTLSTEPMALRTKLDWVAKLSILQGYQQRDGLAWGDARLAAIDIQYSDLRADKGLAFKLMSRGALEKLATDKEIAAAVQFAPEDTRAWFRGECIKRFGAQVAAASWDSVIFDLGEHLPMRRVATPDPARGTRALAENVFAQTETATDLIEALTNR
jgi:proteasome accessory factor A